MSRLTTRLAALRTTRRKALNTFVTAGDPALEATVPAMHALVRGGADIIELGVPFSDPEADGAAIQAASERALANGVRLADVLRMCGEFRRQDATTPVVLMGYLNQFLKYGLAAFCTHAQAAGVDGVIVVNMPPEECAAFKAHLMARDMDLILLVAPTTTPSRASLIAEHASGFVYYVSYKGITGAQQADADAVGAGLAALRPHTGELPVLVGFGIKDGASAARIAVHADGVVVGSVLVQTMAEVMAEAMEKAKLDAIPVRLESQVRDIRTALDALAAVPPISNNS